MFHHVVSLVASANALYPRHETSETRRQVEALVRPAVQQLLSSQEANLLSLVRLVAPSLERERRFGLKAKGLRRLLLSSNALGTKGSPSAAALLSPQQGAAFSSDSETAAFADAVFKCAAFVPCPKVPSVSVFEVDALLDELASFSGFSVDEHGVPFVASKRSQQQVLKLLFEGRAPEEARFLAKVILRIPVTLFHESWVLAAFHPFFWRIFKKHPNLRAACRAIDLEKAASSTDLVRDLALGNSIQVGTNLNNMALAKAHSCSHVIKHMHETLHESEFVAEVKYDGERNQIHFNKPTPSRITLYSKSTRNSTTDRALCHEIILAALGLPSSTSSIPPAHLSPTTEYIPVDSAILDSEILVFNEQTQSIEPYHEARLLVSESARTPNATTPANKHYLLVFFDIMYLNGESLLTHTYDQRRALLERVIRPIRRHASLSETRRFQVAEDPETVCTQLRKHFLQVCARPAEGLVCKGVTGGYEPGSEKLWMKLKKDYIEGFGDTADFAVVGGSYKYDETEYLGVTRKSDAELLNCFFVGCQSNRGVAGELPHFVLLFSVSAGFSREGLLNFSKSTTPIRRAPTSTNLSYTVSRTRFAVDCLFDPPLAVELKGGGFACRAGKWELRGPRVVKEMGRKSMQPSDWKLEYDQLAQIDAKVASKQKRKRIAPTTSRSFQNLFPPTSTTTATVPASRSTTPPVVESLPNDPYLSIPTVLTWQNPPSHSITPHLITTSLFYIPNCSTHFTEPLLRETYKRLSGGQDCVDLQTRIVSTLDALVACTGWGDEEGEGWRSGVVLWKGGEVREWVVWSLEGLEVGGWRRVEVLAVVCVT
ncbi:hypothetical protein HDU98_001722 [Podochytrium sp. JEL0797]|nr:hypothetical protein HDU98_001722 [Podochytrium sp. JEL0797]